MEEWRPIPSYPLYEASSFGRVRRSFKQGCRGARWGQVLATRPTKKGYLTVTLYNGSGVSKIVRLHKLVAEAFLGPCPPGLEVNHKDLNKANCVPNNLEYVTHQRNCQHALENGAVGGLVGSDVRNAILTEADIPKIVALLPTHKHGDIAKMFGVKIGAICGIANGRNWSWLSGITRKEKD